MDEELEAAVEDALRADAFKYDDYVSPMGSYLGRNPDGNNQLPDNSKVYIWEIALVVHEADPLDQREHNVITWYPSIPKEYRRDALAHLEAWMESLRACIDDD